jgi:hypothetical protein
MTLPTLKVYSAYLAKGGSIWSRIHKIIFFDAVRRLIVRIARAL